MRILVVGAGAIGGYFGGRLKEAGRDVTFLVRARRAAQLAKTGLVVKSPLGDVNLPSPPTVMAEALHEHFDLILLSCKAYDLASAVESFAPAVGPHTVILPALNGMAHMDFLGARFGAGAVFGGQCLISTTLDAEGRIIHLADPHLLSFGEQDGSQSPRAQAIAAALSGARFDAKLSPAILQEMWEKWAFIATGAGITCLMRASFGDIVTAGAVEFTTGLYDECCAIAAANDHRAGLADYGVHAARHRARRTDRGRPYCRRSVTPRREGRSRLSPAPHLFCAPEGLRSAPGTRESRGADGLAGTFGPRYYYSA
jgi:2-dehydropantoate 2-reductase